MYGMEKGNLWFRYIYNVDTRVLSCTFSARPVCRYQYPCYHRTKWLNEIFLELRQVVAEKTYQGLCNSLSDVTGMSSGSLVIKCTSSLLTIPASTLNLISTCRSDICHGPRIHKYKHISTWMAITKTTGKTK